MNSGNLQGKVNQMKSLVKYENIKSDYILHL